MASFRRFNEIRQSRLTKNLVGNSPAIARDPDPYNNNNNLKKKKKKIGTNYFTIAEQREWSHPDEPRPPLWFCQ
jgi:hypothetical protein